MNKIVKFFQANRIMTKKQYEEIRRDEINRIQAILQQQASVKKEGKP